MNTMAEPYELDIEWIESKISISDESIELFAERVSEFISEGTSEVDARNKALQLV